MIGKCHFSAFGNDTFFFAHPPCTMAVVLKHGSSKRRGKTRGAVKYELKITGVLYSSKFITILIEKSEHYGREEREERSQEECGENTC